MDGTTPTPPLCWCNSEHGDAAFVVDAVAICRECAEGIARAYPLPAGWQPKAEETP